MTQQSTTRREDQDISTTGVIVTMNTIGDPIVSINIEATADASYALDVGPGTSDPPASDEWFEDEVVYDQADESDPQNIRDTFQVGDGWIRLRVTEPADGTATITIQKAH